MVVKSQISNEYTLSSLKVEGEIPIWLEGVLVRNGPVHISIEGVPSTHWLDGLAMLHAFSIKEGKVSYINRFLRTDPYKKVFEEESLDYVGFTQDPCRNIFKRFFTLFAKSEHLHNANVNVMKICDKYVALTEVPLPVVFDKETLDTLGVLDYEDELPVDHCWQSAHPHYCFENKEYISYLVEYGKRSYYVIYKMKEDSSKREIITKIEVENPSYMHTFALTENYIILAQFPLRVNPLNFLFKSKAFIYNFEWQEEVGTKFMVICKKSGCLLNEISGPSFFAFHHANAYEEDGAIVMDIVTYKDASIISDIHNHGFDDCQNEVLNKSTFKRFILSLKDATISEKVLLSDFNEFPRINELFDGKPYRYCYLANATAPSLESDIRAIYKVDTKTLEVLRWSQKGSYPGEPVFVARPGAVDEDDGVVMNIVVDDVLKLSYLLILDAKTFKELAKVFVDHFIPFGLHGKFFN
jgi:beta,beta-carotene 9',10'-dioxygenase